MSESEISVLKDKIREVETRIAFFNNDFRGQLYQLEISINDCNDRIDRQVRKIRNLQDAVNHLQKTVYDLPTVEDDKE